MTKGQGSGVTDQESAATKSSDNNPKRLARLAAVQGLYQIALTQHSAEQIIKDFRDHPPPLAPDQAGETLAGMDAELFGEIVTGVTQDAAALDEAIAGAFDAKLSANRVEILLRAILRAGAYELKHHAKIPAGVVINDYVDVAHAYFDAKEPGLVNAVLDKLAKAYELSSSPFLGGGCKNLDLRSKSLVFADGAKPALPSFSKLARLRWVR